MWQQWTNVVLGLLIIATPFVIAASTQLTWVMVVGGGLVAILSAWGAQETYTEREDGRMAHSH